MAERQYPFFANTDCESFPCHKGIDPDEFNCAFCYCPLYMLGPDCGGDFKYSKSGTKSCVDCSRPHKGTNGIDMVKQHWEEIKRLGARRE